MASITQSYLAVNNLQQDGRRTVIEVMIDDSGFEYRVEYMAEGDADVQHHLEHSVAALNAQLSGS